MFAGLDGALFSGGFARRREMRFQKLVDALSTDRSSGRLGVEQHRPRAPLALPHHCSHEVTQFDNLLYDIVAPFPRLVFYRLASFDLILRAFSDTIRTNDRVPN
jgi:hypothetical protein